MRSGNNISQYLHKKIEFVLIEPCQCIRRRNVNPRRRLVPQTVGNDSSDDDTENRTPKTSAKKEIIAIIRKLGEEKFWRQTLLRVKYQEEDPLTIDSSSKLLSWEGLAKCVKKYSDDKGKKYWSHFLKSIHSVSCEGEDPRQHIMLYYNAYMSGHKFYKEMRSQLPGANCFLPSDKSFKIIRDRLRMMCLKHWRLQNIPRGMRVSLVEAVKWVAKYVYNFDSLQGVRVDIWGDGMQRGKLDITRMCFRIVGAKNRIITCRAQSRTQIFTFACFCGKDGAMNLELNLGHTSILGAHDNGWLYAETKELVQNHGAVVSSTLFY